jgi:hypothetical protein
LSANGRGFFNANNLTASRAGCFNGDCKSDILFATP